MGERVTDEQVSVFTQDQVSDLLLAAIELQVLLQEKQGEFFRERERNARRLYDMISSAPVR